YHHKPSRIFQEIQEHFVTDEWVNHVDILEKYQGVEIKRRNRFIFDKKRDRLNLTGKDFLYTNYSISMPIEIQNKLLELVTGKSGTVNGKTTAWHTVYNLYRDRDVPNVSKQMGRKTYSRFKEFV